ncbi:MAG: type II 3-dehydroquinate dehydratase [Gemmatimonadetes bacterium]|nr:type II 3-dehydroquinate dehydratase [Gemmatimonadota bacterium]
MESQTKRRRIAVLNGPNLNLLGRREPGIYGSATLEDIEALVREHCAGHGAGAEFFQSNSEAELVEQIHARGDSIDGWVINAAALTHTSIAIRDALLASGRPFVEVHISNVLAREPFRHRSMLAGAAAGVISGFGAQSYMLGVRALLDLLDRGPA